MPLPLSESESPQRTICEKVGSLADVARSRPDGRTTARATLTTSSEVTTSLGIQFHMDPTGDLDGLYGLVNVVYQRVGNHRDAID